MRALKLKPSLVFPLSEVPCEAPWQKREAGQPTVLILNNLLVDVGLEGVNTEQAGELNSSWACLVSLGALVICLRHLNIGT